MTTEADQIVTHVKTAMRGFVEDINRVEPKSGPEWTRRCLTDLCRDAMDLGYKIYVSGGVSDIHRTGHEWLFDACWLAYEDGVLKRIAMACECEWAWGLNRVFEDFEKLLVSCATVRVMIYDTRAANNITQKLLDGIKAFEQTSPGNRYLLIGYGYNEKSRRHWFEIDEYVHPSG